MRWHAYSCQQQWPDGCTLCCPWSQSHWQKTLLTCASNVFWRSSSLLSAIFKQTNNPIGTQLSSPNQFLWNACDLLDCHYLTCLVGGSESCKHLKYPWDQLPHQANLQLVQRLIFLSMICKQGSVRPLKDIAATSVFGNCLCTKINLMNIPQIC
jgi:hypothetical protein